MITLESVASQLLLVETTTVHTYSIQHVDILSVKHFEIEVIYFILLYGR